MLKLRDSHHRIAQLFAAGLTVAEVASETGYNPQYVSSLRGDPAMCDLIATYVEKRMSEDPEDLRGFRAQAGRARNMAMGQINEHLQQAQESGELLRVRELITIASKFAEHTGFGKTQIHQVQHTFAAQLDQAIAASGKVIELRADPSPEAGESREVAVDSLPALTPPVKMRRL